MSDQADDLAKAMGHHCPSITVDPDKLRAMNITAKRERDGATDRMTIAVPAIQ